jgi:hypothetical protein
MKRILLLSFIACSQTTIAFGQVVNPTVIYHDTDIALHYTDAYYTPFAPPGDSDTRLNLSCLGSMDSDGLTHDYYPRIYDTANHAYVKLSDWAPHGTPIGNAVPWQRLFTAMDKPSGAHSDIIAGGNLGDSVIISANEDVDFRATGTIKLENGFHAKPGCYFHAYIAPKFDTTVFQDEFSDSPKFWNQWLVLNNAPGIDGGLDGSYDSNLAIVHDTEAHDGWALRLDLKEDSCYTTVQWQPGSGCFLDSGSSPAHKPFHFSTATLESCPFPFNRPTDPISSAYPNAPYGKYEIREKVPIIEHHTQTYGGGQGNEWNSGEKVNGGLDQIHVGLTRRFRYGPFKGKFSYMHSPIDTATFSSSRAHFTLWNNPDLIIINNFPYQVSLYNTFPTDTILIANATTGHEGGFPSSLVADSTDSVTFYYSKVATGNVSDSLAWSVDSATGTHFTGPYADSLGHILYFNKGYQPTAIYLKPNAFSPAIKYNCHWDHHDGKILLTDTMKPTASHSGYGFSYDCDEGPDYPVPPINMDTTSYKYHTYTMELFPHEAFFLIDGAVRFRFPDRLILPSAPQYDYVSKMPRTPMGIYSLAEIGMDGDSATYAMEKAYFEANSATCQGCWDVNGQHAAHHLVDYVKIWDVPSDIIIPKFPH